MPIQAPQWTEFLSCPVCFHSFDEKLRSPISLGCSHTICKVCLSNLHRKQCPFDQTNITIDIDSLPVNTALLQLVTPQTNKKNSSDSEDNAIDAKIVPTDCISYYLTSKKCVEELALYLKQHPNGANVSSTGSTLSRPMQRKLVTLINCQLVEDEGRTRAMRAARSLGERTVTELILQHQNPQQLSANLWAAVRQRGCQFLGPAMQEEVLKLVLLALEDGSALSRKVLVMFVVQRLEPHFPQASKTSIGHVVQLLYRASCFKVSKREGDSSLMQLKEEFRTYEALRREHDAQIVQIATEAGLRIAPDQWSSLLYGDTTHKSHMQSIIDKLQTPQSFAQSVQELLIALQRTGDPGKLSVLRSHLDLLAAIDPSPESAVPSWKECAESLEAVKQVVAGLVEFIHQHGSRKLQDNTHSQHAKYKISMCRDLTTRGSCPRGTNCTFAHNNEELEKYRAKNRKSMGRNKDHRSDNPSPTDKIYTQSDEFYPIPNTAAVSPVPIPTIHMPIQRIGYDFSYNPTFNPNTGYSQMFAAQPPPPPPPMFPPELFSPNPHNVVTANGSQLLYTTPPQTEFVPTAPQPTNIDIGKPPHWDMMMQKNQNVATPPKPSRTPTKSLAELHQRKLEVISQLEKMVGKDAAFEISTSAHNLARQESQIDPESPLLPASGWTFTPGPTFVRSDSILAADDSDVPYDPPSISKFGPISRMQKDNGLAQQLSGNFRDGSLPSSANHLPLSTANPGNNHWYLNNNGYFQNALPGHTVVGPPGNGLNEGYFTYGSQQWVVHPKADPSKEILAESQRVKMQLRNLERQLKDLQLAAEEVSISKSERLSQELRLIEQGIQEKQKEATLNKIMQLTLGNYNNGNITGNDDEAYDAGIANNMRKLEIRLQEEIEEWSGEDSPK